jgi:GNAT superfamily N-acetyltransferase
MTPAEVRSLNHLVAQMSRQPHVMSEEHYRRLVAFPGAVFVARDGERIVGLAQLVVNVLPSKIKGWAEDVVVDEDYRGKGIARKLLELVVAEARQAGCKHLNLTSGNDRAEAQALYAALGFKLRDSQLYRLDL